MLHIICEDETSGFEFWKAVNKCILQREDGIKSANGIANVKNTLLKLNVNKGDYVLLVIDNIDVNKHVSDLIELAEKDSLDRQYDLLITDYFSFEEFLLSFKHISKWGMCDNEELNNMVSYIHKSLYADRPFDYYREFRSLFPKFIEVWNLRNRERLAHRLLSQVTLPSGKRFFVDKHSDKSWGYIGECWVSDCISHEDNLCDACVLEDSNMKLLQKLEYIANNSIAVLADINFVDLKSYL